MEKLEEVFAQYEIDRKKMFRGRKMLMCEDIHGNLYGIMETKATEYRLVKEYLVKQYLIQQGFEHIDQLVCNKSGNFISEDRYHTPFLLKTYFTGKECDANDRVEVKDAAANLACLHKAGKGIAQWLCQQEECYWNRKNMLELERKEEGKATAQTEIMQETQEEMEVALSSKKAQEPKRLLYKEELVSSKAVLAALFEKRNLELKRISSYMKKPGRKGEFVTSFNNYAPQFLQEAKEATKQLKDLAQDGTELAYGLCHGSYQHHNILKINKGLATVGLENFHFGVQLEDLYDFLRKILEKNDYQFSYAKTVIEGYEKERRLTKEEFQYLYIRLSYPDKFWKIANHYYNAKKTWVPPKTIEKLNKIVEQNTKKKKFLEEFHKMFINS